MKQKFLIMALILGFSLLVGYRSAYALFSDSVQLMLSIGTANYEIDEFDFQIIEDKPIIFDKVLPADWSEEGVIRLRSRTNLSTNAYFYITETDGNICEDVNIKIEVSENESGPWIEIYNDEIEELRGDNDKIKLNLDDFNLSEFLFVKQKVQLDKDANKNSQGMPCLWDEIFTLENENQDYLKKEIITRNKLNAFYWISPEVEVKDPDDKEEYRVGQIMTIRWKAKSSTKDQEDKMKIKAILMDESGEEEIMIIADELENDGLHEWIIPEELYEEDKQNKYKVKIEVVDENGLENRDESDEAFKIIPADN